MAGDGTYSIKSTVGEAFIGTHSVNIGDNSVQLDAGFWNMRFIEAEFSASEVLGYQELESVELTDISSAYQMVVASCFWDFGDGSTEEIQLSDEITN